MCLCTASCVFACAPFLAAIYVSALIWQALPGCRQAGRQLDNGPCSACWKNTFKAAAGRECLFFFFLLSLSSAVSRFVPDGIWHRSRLARAVEDLASASSPSHFVSPLTLCYYRLERGHIQDEKQVSQEKCESLYAFSWYQHQLPLSPSCPPLSLCLLSTSVSFLSSLSLSLGLCSIYLVPLFPLSPSLLSVYSWTA